MAIAYVQDFGDFTSSGASVGPGAISVTPLGSNPTPGDASIVMLGFNSAGTSTYALQDTNGNVYTASPLGKQVGFDNVGFQCFYLLNAPANAVKTMTCTISGSASTLIGLGSEWSGVATTSPIDTEAAHISGTFQTNINDPTVTPTVDGDLLIAPIFSFGGTLTSIDSPWTLAPTTGIVAATIAQAYLIQGTAGAQALAATQGGGNSRWTAIISAFKAASGPPPPTAQQVLKPQILL